MNVRATFWLHILCKAPLNVFVKERSLYKSGIHVILYLSLSTEKLADAGYAVVPVEIKRREACELVVSKQVIWRCNINELGQ